MPHHYWNSHATWHHTVLPATRQRWHFRLYPSQWKLVLNVATLEGCKAELTYLAWLHTEVVYPPEDGHPSQYQPGSTLSNFVHAMNDTMLNRHLYSWRFSVVVASNSSGSQEGWRSSVSDRFCGHYCCCNWTVEAEDEATNTRKLMEDKQRLLNDINRLHAENDSLKVLYTSCV